MFFNNLIDTFQFIHVLILIIVNELSLMFSVVSESRQETKFESGSGSVSKDKSESVIIVEAGLEAGLKSKD